MSLPLTQIDGVPDRNNLIRGVAYFAGTGPASEVCRNCKNYGYVRESRFKNYYHTTACHMFKKLTGKHGPRINKSTPACKYFDKRQQKTPA